MSACLKGLSHFARLLEKLKSIGYLVKEGGLLKWTMNNEGKVKTLISLPCWWKKADVFKHINSGRYRNETVSFCHFLSQFWIFHLCWYHSRPFSFARNLELCSIHNRTATQLANDRCKHQRTASQFVSFTIPSFRNSNLFSLSVGFFVIYSCSDLKKKSKQVNIPLAS